MVGFFTNIQSKFEGGSYAGRYLAEILAELANSNEREAFFNLIEASGIKLNNRPSISVRTERLFRGKKQNRLADLAIISSSDDEDNVLVEIKDEDGKSKPNDAQLRDYVEYIKRRNRSPNTRTWLLFISKYPPRLEDDTELRRGGKYVKRLSYNEIYKTLSKSDAKPISKMLRDYLEDKGVIYRELLSKQDSKSLKELARTSLGGLPNVKLRALRAQQTIGRGPRVGRPSQRRLVAF
jgi:PD-(D/E)XK nuclease superfamily